MADWHQDEIHTWKLCDESYHTPLHGRTLFMTFFALSRHLSRRTGVQKWLFLWLKQDHNGRQASGWILHLEMV
jgi:hypothetical protein